MPLPETLSFSCPHCSTRLTVPAKLAGVTGPCPGCKQSITAPALASAPEPEPVPVEVAPQAIQAPSEPLSDQAAAIAPLALPTQQELPLAASEAPPSSVPAHPPVPANDEPVLVEVSPVPVPEGHRIKPEPRNRREKSAASPISPKHSTGDETMRRSEQAYTSPSTPGTSRVLRASGAAAFCAVATTLSYLLLYFFLPTGPGKKLKEASKPLANPPPKTAAASPESPPTPPAPEKTTTAPLQAPQSVTADDSIPSPEASEKESPAVLANNVLDSFLNAKDAASRVGLVEPAATEEELAATLLKSPLPEIARILPDLPQRDAVEQFTDYPYRVSFFLQSGRNVDFTIVVRQRGEQAPKVFLPAFLDLAGGRLSAFAKEPNKSDPVTFHVILDPLSVCHDDQVPGADRKITFKLLPSMFGKEITRAYVSSGSRFAQMVGDPNSSLRWGVRMRATITVQWNYTEDPQKPYLELMNISSLNWNS